MTNQAYRILTINSGSSSIKFSLYEIGQAEEKKCLGQTEKIGESTGSFVVKDTEGRYLVDQHLRLPDHRHALQVILEWLRNNPMGQNLDAIGHRVVHGGRQFMASQWVTEETITELREIVPLAPAHLPHELDAIEVVMQHYPEVKQIACFDTAFHRNMPKVAQVFPLTMKFWDEGIQRYGFHGLSCEFILGQLSSEAGGGPPVERIIIAHLGHGCSMTAVYHGQSVDTTMGLTPTGGLVMSRRPGDLDPGLLLHLLEQKRMTPAEVSEIVNHKGGLLGISPRGNDMRDLLENEKEDPLAALAVALFCYQAKKFLGALATVLGGLDTLVFTGGIGENAPAVRWRICEGLGFLGVRLDRLRNEANATRVSPDASPVKVRVLKTNEELVIARHAYQLLQKEPGRYGK